MAMKKAIIRTEVEYDDSEITPDDITQELIEITKQHNRYQLTKARHNSKLAFIGKCITKAERWSILCIYYPYKKKTDE
jgi:hypothetical protein